MTPARTLILTLLVATLAVTACGKKGNPIRPGDEPKKEKSLFD